MNALCPQRGCSVDVMLDGLEDLKGIRVVHGPNQVVLCQARESGHQVLGTNLKINK